MIGTMDSHNVEVGVIRADGKFKILGANEIKEYIDELQ
jgi:hypothetical protein